MTQSPGEKEARKFLENSKLDTCIRCDLVKRRYQIPPRIKNVV